MMFCLLFRNAQNPLQKNKVKLTSIFIGDYSFGRIRVRKTNGSFHLPLSPGRSRNLSWSSSCGALLVGHPPKRWEVWFVAWQRSCSPSTVQLHFGPEWCLHPCPMSLAELSRLLSRRMSVLGQNQGSSAGIWIRSFLFLFFRAFPMNPIQMVRTRYIHACSVCCSFSPIGYRW